MILIFRLHLILLDTNNQKNTNIITKSNDIVIFYLLIYSAWPRDPK